jgi:hypothetical protein
LAYVLPDYDVVAKPNRKTQNVLLCKIHTTKVVAHFLYENISIQFGCPLELMNNHGNKNIYAILKKITKNNLI